MKAGDARGDATPSGDVREEAVEMEWQKKQKEYEIKKARAKALKLRLTCTICGGKAKLKCPCGTAQCAPGACANASRRAVTRDPQVLLDGVPTHRLARPGPPQGVQADPGRARGGGGAGRGTDAPAVPAGGGGLRSRAAVARG